MNLFFQQKKLFLDTNVIIFGTTHATHAAYALLNEGYKNLYSNEYCIKETRWHLQEKIGFSPHKANQVIDWIRQRVKITTTPPVKEFKKLVLPDELKQDKPVVKSALDLSAVLVTYDHKMLREAKRYVETHNA